MARCNRHGIHTAWPIELKIYLALGLAYIIIGISTGVWVFWGN